MRLRVRYQKVGKVRFLSHRDLARVWERAIRRADLPVLYSEGFSPRPKMHFGLALSTGYESIAEYIDLDLDVEPGDEALVDLLARLNHATPSGISATGLGWSDRTVGSLQDQVDSCTWTMWLCDPGTDRKRLADVAERLLAADTLPLQVERKGAMREVDLRPQLLGLVVGDLTDDQRDLGVPALPANSINEPVDGLPVDAVPITVELGTKPRGIRPAELLGVIDPDQRYVRVRRLAQWTNTGTLRSEPLEVGSDLSAEPPVTHSQTARAS